MEQKQLFKQMIELNHVTLNNVFDAMVLVQDRFENIARGTMDMAPGLLAEKREAIDNWVELYKSGRDSIKQQMSENFEQAEKLFTLSKGDT